MDKLTALTAFIGEIGILLAVIIPVFASIHKLRMGIKCQLRSEMLRIYYRHDDTKSLRQYEYENFVELYEAYKALKGNSFIDKIYAEVKQWKVNS